LAWRTTIVIEQRTGLESIIVKAEQFLALERDQSFKDSEEQQVVKLIHHPPRPPRMPYKISCFIPGDHSTFPVNIDETEFVDDLKGKIKAQKPEGLATVDADTLTLYQATLDESYDEEKRINELKQLSQHLNECTELDEVQLVSVYFDKIPPGKVYYTLVQVPDGKSIYCGGVALLVLMPGTKRSQETTGYPSDGYQPRTHLSFAKTRNGSLHRGHAD